MRWRAPDQDDREDAVDRSKMEEADKDWLMIRIIVCLLIRDTDINPW